MRGLSRLLIVLLVLAVLPLRGYAAVAASLCDTHHGGDAAAHTTAQGHGHPDDGHDHARTADKDGTLAFDSMCSLCATCSVGATLAPDPLHAVALVPTGAAPIPFDGLTQSGRVPGVLDRPPLSL